MKKYFKLWWFFTKNTTSLAMQSRFGSSFFLIGKILRFFVLFYFFYLLLGKTQNLAGFSFWQIVFFYATFNLVDTTAQFLLREVYRFRVYVLKGFFDYILTKPMSPLFRSLFGGSDVLDIPLILLALGFLVYSAFYIGSITFSGILLYLVLLANALAIALAFHIFVLGIGIISSEVDSMILLYRDISRMGQIPVDVYRAPVSFIITFILPVGIMMSFPVKALLGILSWQYIFIAFLFAASFLLFSLQFWKYALRQYQSASS